MFVKICGITDVDDGLLAVALGADALGFVFAPSTRQIAPKRARDIAARVPAETLTVGVFRNELRERVVDIVHTAGLRGAQLHGAESPEDTEWIANRVPHVIKALTAGTDQARHAVEYSSAAVILIDAPTPGAGDVFDWSLAETMPLGLKILLAGGLTPDNVAEAIGVVKPWGVDVSTGVEREPGHKDPTALRRFITNARDAGERLREDDPQRVDDEELYNWEIE